MHAPPPTDRHYGYGQWSGGTHPTGMHSCYIVVLLQRWTYGWRFKYLVGISHWGFDLNSVRTLYKHKGTLRYSVVEGHDHLQMEYPVVHRRIRKNVLYSFVNQRHDRITYLCLNASHFTSIWRFLSGYGRGIKCTSHFTSNGKVCFDTLWHFSGVVTSTGHFTHNRKVPFCFSFPFLY